MWDMNNYGFTLLECIMIIAILAISYTIAFAHLPRFIYTYTATTTIQQLQQILHYGRSVAIAQQKNIIICPSYDRSHCAVEWGSGILLIGDNIKQHFNLNLGTHGLLTLQQYGSSNYKIELLASGFLNNNGHFTFKSSKHQDWQQYNLYFNKALRTYLRNP